MQDYLFIAQIIMSVALIVAILLQSKGGGLGNLFGGDPTGQYKTRRGLEKTLFQATIGLSGIFLLLSVVNSLVLAN